MRPHRIWCVPISKILAENPEFDGALADFSFLQGTLVSFLWPEVEDQTQTYPTLTIYYVDPARLTGLYERREGKTGILPGKPVFRPGGSAILSGYGQPGGQAHGIRLGCRLVRRSGQRESGALGRWSCPWSWRWRWRLCSPGERRRGMDTLQATSLRGRAGAGRGKTAVGPCLCGGDLRGVCGGSGGGPRPSGWGSRAGTLPIQLIKMLTTAPMNMLQAECYELACLLGSALGFAGVALLLSALLPGTTATLVAALLTTWGPQILNQYLPWSVQQYLRLLPFVGGAEDIFRQNLYHWFGLRIWSPGPLLVIPLLVGAACLPAAALAWCRKRSR